MIQAGIAKNWTGLGNTAFFGEYSISNDWGAGIGAGRTYDVDPTVAACQTAAPAVLGGAAGLTGLCTGVTDTKLTVWGLGVTQNIDAAATELYLDWRHFSADIKQGRHIRADRGWQLRHWRRAREVLIDCSILNDGRAAPGRPFLFCMPLAPRQCCVRATWQWDHTFPWKCSSGFNRSIGRLVMLYTGSMCTSGVGYQYRTGGVDMRNSMRRLLTGVVLAFLAQPALAFQENTVGGSQEPAPPPAANLETTKPGLDPAQQQRKGLNLSVPELSLGSNSGTEVRIPGSRQGRRAAQTGFRP